MMEIKKIDILSAAKLSASLAGGIYLAIGVVLSVVVAILGIPAISSFDVLNIGSFLLATLLSAMVMAAVSFIMAAILAWLYNVFAKFFGGIKIELEPAKESIIKFAGLEQEAQKRKLAQKQAINPAECETDKKNKDDSFKS